MVVRCLSLVTNQTPRANHYTQKMVQLRRNNQRNKLNQLNRLVWMGLVFLMSVLMVLAAMTNMFTESPLKKSNIVLIFVVLLGLVFYIYSWVKFFKRKD